MTESAHMVLKEQSCRGCKLKKVTSAKMEGKQKRQRGSQLKAQLIRSRRGRI